jgi:arylsulfatase A-like enzyme
LLGLADWIASGASTPATLVVLTLGGGGLAGGLAGGLQVALGRRGLALGLVLALGIALEGFSMASKELAGAARMAAFPAVLVVALLALAFAQRRPATDRGANVAWAWLALAAIPLGSLLAYGLAALGPWRTAALATPLVVLLLEHALARSRRAPQLLAGLSLVLLAGPDLMLGHEPPRAELATIEPKGASLSGRPSIVLLVIDTLRADALPPDGELARIGREGVRFEQALSAAPWTLPSVASLLTGLHPSQHGAVTAGSPLPLDVTTLAEVLRASGYATAAFTGGAFVGSAHRLDQGFELFDPRCERRFPPFTVHTPLVWRLAKNRYFPLRPLVRWVDEYRGFAGVTAAAREWAEQRRAHGDRRPFLLFLHTYQVHDYYLYDPPVDDEVLASAGSAPFSGRLSVHPSELAAAPQADLDRFRRIYEARIGAVEAELPALEALVRDAAGDEVVWAVTSDHGEGFDAAHRRVHHGGRLHDDLLRVPLLLRARGRLPSGRVVTEQVRTIDLLPTLLELAGIEAPPGLAGESLLGAIAGARPFPGLSFAEELARGYGLRSARRADWKLIQGPLGEQGHDLAADPLELEPRSAPEELRAALAGFPQRFPARAIEEAELDAGTLEELRTLGYVR